MSMLCIFNPTEKVMIVLMFSELCCYKPQCKDVQWFNSCPLPLKPSAKKYSLHYLYWNRLSMIKLFSKNRVHRVLELELERTNINCTMF